MIRRFASALALSLALLAIAGATPALAAIDMFVNLGPGIKGESMDAAHRDWTDVLAYQWGAANSGGLSSGGAGTGKAQVRDFSFTKYADIGSPKLLEALLKGQHIPTVVVELRKAGDKPLVYRRYEFTDVVVSSWREGGSGGEDRTTENVTLRFAKLKMTHTPQKADGTAGLPVSVIWDLIQNIAQ